MNEPSNFIVVNFSKNLRSLSNFVKNPFDGSLSEQQASDPDETDQKELERLRLSSIEQTLIAAPFGP